MDTNESASWLQAERRDASNKKTKRKLKGVKWTTITIKVPLCPKCNAPMQHELDVDCRALWKWFCRKCNNKL